MSYDPVSLAVATLPPQPTFQQCYTAISSPLADLHTQDMTPCANQLQYFQPSSPMSDLRDNSPTFSSGSSAHHSSNATDEDTEEQEQEVASPIIFSPVSEVFEYRSLLDAPPIYSLDSMLGYSAARVIFIEKLLWSCVGKIYGIYGEPIIRTRGFVASMPLQQLVHEGIVHGLCNEIVIMPIMAATQKLPGSQHQHADVIPFPLFMAEMLRRMRSSYFLLQTAMRYILDIEQQIRAARERAACGWCRSGVNGCEHSNPPESGSTSRFAKGRSANLRKPAAHNPPLKPTDFTAHDALHPLSDPRKAFLGALILANKFHRDRSIGNKAWAAMIGLQLEEVHSAERAVGKAIGWTLSRPWVRDVRDDSGNWVPGSTHPSFAEPLFASTDAEATKYGVKALRESGGIPAALDSRQLATEFPRGDIYIDSIYSTPPNSLPFPLPDALSRRSRSQTFSITEERPIAPLPQRSTQVFLQPRTKSNNLIKKGSSAPDVLQQSFPSGSSLAVEIDMAMQSEWTTLTSTRNPLDNLMDATPTMEQVRSKRKASQDFGPNGLLRRGILGQRVLVHSPDEMASVISHSADASQDHQWDMCDDESCPELSPGTPTTTSPSIGLLTRTNTPSNLLEMAISVTKPISPPPHKNRSSQCFAPFGLTDCSSHHTGSHSYDGLLGTSSDLSLQH